MSEKKIMPRAVLARLKLSRAQWLWAGAAGALFVLLGWLMWPRPEFVRAVAIDRGEVVQDIVDEGRTRIHDVFVIAAPVGGELQRVELEAGDAVARGQIVAVIAPGDSGLLDARIAAEARAAVNAAQSSVTAADAAADLARRDQARTSALAAQGFASRAALDSANAALRSARAEAAAARAELQRARAAASAPGSRQGGRVSVRSPAAGRVLRLLQESERVVAPGAPLMEIGDPADLEVVAEFLSQDATILRVGAQAMIENWGGETPIPARITRIEPFAHTKVSALGVEEQRVNVILRLQDPAAAPPLGHQFRVDVRATVSRQDNVLRAPVDALVRQGEGWAVFRIEGGRARLVPVQVGAGGERYRAVSAGLSVGDRVILFPREELADGALVYAR